MNYYHGTSDVIPIDKILLPPCDTNCKREDGRNKFNDVVFFTPSLLSATTYARKASVKFGGNPVVLIVSPIGEAVNVVNNEYISDKAIVVDRINQME